MRRRWTVRILGLAVLEVVGVAGLALLDTRAHLPALTLVVVLVATTLWLLLDSLDDEYEWSTGVAAAPRQVAGDQRLGTHTRILEDHLAAREPTPALRDRLRWMVAERLELHHDLGLDDPGARDLVGADLMRLLLGPPRRIPPSELTAALDRIEEL